MDLPKTCKYCSNFVGGSCSILENNVEFEGKTAPIFNEGLFQEVMRERNIAKDLYDKIKDLIPKTRQNKAIELLEEYEEDKISELADCLQNVIDNNLGEQLECVALVPPDEFYCSRWR